jgi:acetyl esterase/lipase
MRITLWDDALEESRATIRAEARQFMANLPDGDPGTGSPLERARAIRKGDETLVLRSERAVERTIDGPGGPLTLREFRPARAKAVLLHFHGGGWLTGQPAVMDPLHDALSNDLDLAVVSVDYRLAPEHPFPAGPDDCEAAALWLVAEAASEFGTDRLLVGGESAGAHLSALTLLRLRDRHGLAERFCGADLVFGAYDLSSTPSATGVGTSDDLDVLSRDRMLFFYEQFTPGWSTEDRRSPELSPLYADLRGMPPALFTVGTADHLVDDTLFFAQRWLVAGNHAELLVYPDAPHACIGLPSVLAHWWPRRQDFLRRCMSGTLDAPAAPAAPGTGARP